MTAPTPELGQALFSNGEILAHGLDDDVHAGLVLLAHAITTVRGEDPDRDGLLVDNWGCEPYVSDVFAMRTYCWCDGAREDHEDQCPPNFEHFASGFKVAWYKHSGRSATQNRRLVTGGWLDIFTECFADVRAGVAP